jgi:glycosyltransferase involved in cell wall biosynthesis
MTPAVMTALGRDASIPRIVDIINLSSSAQTLLRDRVLALRAKGVDNHIVCIDGPYVSSLRADGIPVATVHFPRGLDPFRLVWSLLQVTAYLRRVKPDLVHTHCSVPGVVGRLAARLAGVPVVMHTVHGFHFHDQGRGFTHALAVAVERFVGRFTDVLLSQNRADLEQAVRLRIVPRDRAHYVGNGIAVERFPVAPARRSADRPVVITCVARMERVKNHAMLIEGARRLADRGVAFELRLVGGGSGRAALESHAAALGLGAHVRFLGYRDDIPALLAQSDIGVLTSLKEGIPRAALESMVVGLPMVATRVNGTREVVRHGDTGFLVETGDVRALAEALERLARDPALRARMGERGRDVVRAEFDEAVIVRRLERMYRDCLTRRGIRVPAALAREVNA